MAEYFTKDGENFVKVADPLLPQSDVDSIVEKRLERERSKYADYDTLKEKAGKVDTVKQEYEDKLKERDTKLSDFEKQLGSARLETEKVKIVHKYKLPEDLHEFVVGDSVDDMEKRAEKLSKGVTGGGIKLDKEKKPSEAPSDSKKIAKSLFGSKSD